MSDYTPSTEEVRNAFTQTSVWLPRTPFKDYGETFDRWKAANDAAVLRAAADEIRAIFASPDRQRPRDPAGEYPTDLLNDPQWAEHIVRQRADRIEKEGTA